MTHYQVDLDAARAAMVKATRRLMSAQEKFSEEAPGADAPEWWRLHTSVVTAQAAYQAACRVYEWHCARIPAEGGISPLTDSGEAP